MSLLNEIEPLKLSALAELKAAPDLAALEQTKGAWIGPNGKFTALMKQLGTLPKEEKPAAGKLFAQWLPVAGESVEFTVTRAGDDAIFTIADQGRGIPAADRIANFSGGAASAMSLKQLSDWCKDIFTNEVYAERIAHTIVERGYRTVLTGGGPADLTHVLATLGIRYLRLDQMPLAMASIVVALPFVLPLVFIMMKRLSK